MTLTVFAKLRAFSAVRSSRLDVITSPWVWFIILFRLQLWVQCARATTA